MIINSVVLALVLVVIPHKTDIALRAMASNYYAVQKAGSVMLEKYVLASPTGYNYLRMGLHSKDAEVVSRCCAVAMQRYRYMVQGWFQWKEDVHRYGYDDEPCEGCSECNYSGVVWPNSNFKFVVGFANVYFPL